MIDLHVKSMVWVWSILGLHWVSRSGSCVGVPSGVTWSCALLIDTSSLVGIDAMVSSWSLLLIKLNMEGMVWLRGILGLHWICRSGSGVGVPCRVTWGGALLIDTSCLVSINTVVSGWSLLLIKL